MEEGTYSNAICKTKQKKQSLCSSTNKAHRTNCSPQYIRSRSSVLKQTPVLDIEGDKVEHSIKNTSQRMKRKIAKQLFPSNKERFEHYKEITTVGMPLNTPWPTGWFSDDEGETLQDRNDDQHQLEGYSSENDKDSLYRMAEHETSEDVGEWFNLDDSSSKKMVLFHGQRFRNVSEFRRAVQVFAIREGFKLCVMENRNHLVCCECANLRCDWIIQGERVPKGMTFVVTKFIPNHKCTGVQKKFHLSSKWISAMYLHRWKEQPNVSTIEIKAEIEATYGVICPEWNLYCAANRAKYILSIDHEDGYAMLKQFKEEMERIDRHNIVLLETDKHESGEKERFKRMFVCWDRTAYAFKNHCRGLLAVDGWKINNPCNSVMLVAAGLDGDNGILPVAFCEVNVEDLESWVYFLKNINNALRLENGKGLCILADGDNGIDYAVEEYLPHAAYRQCCHKIFTEMVKRYPSAPVQHLFWSACRSTSATAFYKYMDLIIHQSQECHDWLMQTNWSNWALFMMPEWVKCTCLTLSITNKLRNYLHRYLSFNIGRRFVGIARLMSELFEQRRMVVWKWYKEKVTPTVRDVIHDRCIDGQRFIVIEHNGTRLKLIDESSSVYDLNIQALSCTCGLWTKSGIPCAHACKGIQLNKGNVEEYVDNKMSVQNFWSMYAPGMMQLPKEHAWKWHVSDIVLPPITQSLDAASAKGSNEIATNTMNQHTVVSSPVSASNLQWTEENSVNYPPDMGDMLQIISSTSDDSISL